MGMGSGEAAVNAAALSNAALGDRNYPVTWWSVCITKGNADLTLLYFHRFNAWLTVCAVKGAGSTGRCDKKGQLHLQAIVCLHSPPDNFGSCLIRDSIKTEFPIPTGAGYRVDAKPFAPTQTPIWVAMYSGITVNRGSTSRGFNSVMLGVSDTSERIQLRRQRGRERGGRGGGERKCVFFPHKKTAKQTNKIILSSAPLLLFYSS
jgi:hypothetical protein